MAQIRIQKITSVIFTIFLFISGLQPARAQTGATELFNKTAFRVVDKTVPQTGTVLSTISSGKTALASFQLATIHPLEIISATLKFSAGSTPDISQSQVGIIIDSISNQWDSTSNYNSTYGTEGFLLVPNVASASNVGSDFSFDVTENMKARLMTGSTVSYGIYLMDNTQSFYLISDTLRIEIEKKPAVDVLKSATVDNIETFITKYFDATTTAQYKTLKDKTLINNKVLSADYQTLDECKEIFLQAVSAYVKNPSYGDKAGRNKDLQPSMFTIVNGGWSANGATYDQSGSTYYSLQYKNIIMGRFDTAGIRPETVKSAKIYFELSDTHTSFPNSSSKTHYVVMDTIPNNWDTTSSYRQTYMNTTFATGITKNMASCTNVQKSFTMDITEQIKSRLQSESSVSYALTLRRDQDTFKDVGFYFNKGSLKLIFELANEAQGIYQSTPANEDVEAPINSEISMAFEAPLDESTVKKSNFKITKNGTEISAYTVTLLNNNLEIGFKLDEGLEYNTEYIIYVSSNLAYSNNSTIYGFYNLMFKTEQKAFEIDGLRLYSSAKEIFSINEAENDHISAKLNIVNNKLLETQRFVATIVLYSKTQENDKMIQIVGSSAALNAGDAPFELNAEFNIPKTEAGNYKIACYVWDSFVKMKKVYSKIIE